MPMTAIAETITAIIAEKALLQPGDIAPEMTINGLGIDSLGLVEAIFAIEEHFDIQVPFEAANPEASGFDLSSVAAIIRAVEGLVAQQAA